MLAANVTGGMVRQEQRLILVHVYVHHDAHANDLHLRATVFVEEAEGVPLIGGASRNAASCSFTTMSVYCAHALAHGDVVVDR